MSFYLQDSSLALWLVDINNFGQLTTTPSAVGTDAGIVLLSSGGFYFNLDISTSGLLLTVSTSAASVPNITLAGPNGLTWQLGVNDIGAILTTLIMLVGTTPGVVADDYQWLGGDAY